MSRVDILRRRIAKSFLQEMNCLINLKEKLDPYSNFYYRYLSLINTNKKFNIHTSKKKGTLPETSSKNESRNVSYTHSQKKKRPREIVVRE